jgi:hypothetical protein
MVVLAPPALVDRWRLEPVTVPATLTPEWFLFAEVMPVERALLAAYPLSVALPKAMELLRPSAAVSPFRAMAETSSSRVGPVRAVPADLS